MLCCISHTDDLSSATKESNVSIMAHKYSNSNLKKVATRVLQPSTFQIERLQVLQGSRKYHMDTVAHACAMARLLNTWPQLGSAAKGYLVHGRSVTGHTYGAAVAWRSRSNLLSACDGVRCTANISLQSRTLYQPPLGEQSERKDRFGCPPKKRGA